MYSPVLQLRYPIQIEINMNSKNNMNSKKYNSLPVDASNWLKVCLDPYHDYQTTIEGCPDQTIGRSSVRVINQAITVSATAANDKMTICFNGGYGVTTHCEQGIVTGSNHAWEVSPVMVLRSAAANEASLANYIDGTATVIGALENVVSPTVPSRLIAMALEVHDVTPPLYTAGTMTIAPYTGVRSFNKLMRTNSLPFDSPESNFLFPQRPGTQALIQQVTNSLTWPAKRGAYIQARMYRPQGPNTFKNPAGNYIYHPCTFTEMGAIERALCSSAAGGVVASEYALHALPSMVDSGFEPFIVHLSGLTAESSFRITLRCIVEIFPDFSDPSQLSLATESPTYSPDAFMIYHNVIRTLPCAMPVSSNAAGDYWRLVLSVLKKVAPTVIDGLTTGAGMMFGPQGTAIGSVVNPILKKMVSMINTSSSGNPLPRRAIPKKKRIVRRK